MIYAVEQFFENGGRQGVIVRICNGGRPAVLGGNCCSLELWFWLNWKCVVTQHVDPLDRNGLLDESITGHEIRESGPPALDLSKINFEALAQCFKESQHKNTDLEDLKAAIRAQLAEVA